MYLEIIKPDNLKKDTSPLRGGWASNRGGSVLSDVGRNPGSLCTTGGRHLKQNHTQATRKCVILKESNLSFAMCRTWPVVEKQVMEVSFGTRKACDRHFSLITS